MYTWEPYDTSRVPFSHDTECTMPLHDQVLDTMATPVPSPFSHIQNAQCPFMTKCFDAFEDHGWWWLVMENSACGDLFSVINAAGAIHEEGWFVSQVGEGAEKYAERTPASSSAAALSPKWAGGSRGGGGPLCHPQCDGEGGL